MLKFCSIVDWKEPLLLFVGPESHKSLHALRLLIGVCGRISTATVYEYNNLFMPVLKWTYCVTALN